MKRNVLTVFMLAVFSLGLCASAFAGDKQDYDLNWYGYIKLDGSYDQNLTSHGNFSMWVNPQEYGEDDEQFNMTANQTRFGVKLNGQPDNNTAVNGNIEFDLYAGVSGGTVAQNKPMLQLRHAYFSIQFGNTKLLAGQTWDLISPLNPSTFNYPVLWGCGNTGYRRPQISLWHTFEAGQSTDVTMAGGFFRTIGGDLTPTFTLAAGETPEGSDDGTDAGIPTIQGRLDVQSEFTNSNMRVGVSGLYGTLKAETNQGNNQDYESWAVVGHFMFASQNGFGLSGEVYSGQNMQSYMGGILNNSTIDGVQSFGGWGSLWAQVSPKVKLSAGAGLDNPDSDDVSVGDRSQNLSIFGNIKYAIIPQAAIGFELSHWTTEYKQGADSFDEVSNLRAQTSLIFNF